MAERRFYVNKPNINANTIVINDSEHNHIRNVLRLVAQDKIIVVCGDGNDYHATIESVDKTKTIANIDYVEKNVYDSNANVSVFQALIKKDNLNLVVEKLTELGIKEFVPFESAFTTVKDKVGKSDKLQIISNQSIKQCKRSVPMFVHETQSFKNMLKMLANYDMVIFANETENKNNIKELSLKKDQNIAIIVGSEGGFKDTEIKDIVSAGSKSIGLGKRILRAETAAIAIASIVMYQIDELS